MEEMEELKKGKDDGNLPIEVQVEEEEEERR